MWTFAIRRTARRLPTWQPDVDRLERRLMDCVKLGRGMRVGGRDSIPETEFLPDPKFIPLSEHLLWGGPWTCSFFYVLLSDSGKAMFVDYGHAFMPHMHIGPDHDGMETMRFVEHHLEELRDDYGVTHFDLVVPTHIHDDHTCGIPFLQRHHGTQCWALEEVGQVPRGSGCLGEHALHISQTDQDRPLAQRWRDVSLGGNSNSRFISRRDRRNFIPFSRG